MFHLLKAGASEDDPSRIINMSSISGLHVPTYEMNAYSSSKAGLNHLTRLLSNQLSSHNITVNAIAPGFASFSFFSFLFFFDF